ncbi:MULTISPECIES: hypothetical protein [unclassified Curtobacterium]|nr:MULTISPECIES: hypothetical protein [unclassified Curtobacterium]WIB63312.1 hypothetical protein DEI94_14365 [Curtobacterium sp. MCBD17_040]WIB67150.1 hypothetical protein DEI93_14515 [Curtobacterium sp. MCBD17_035]WIE54336.1 hypothetical protein DEI88_014635 [Curtobacterium sp. MCBD17_003]
MFALLRYLPVIVGIVRHARRDPQVQRALAKAKQRRAAASRRRR